MKKRWLDVLYSETCLSLTPLWMLCIVLLVMLGLYVLKGV